MSLMENKTTVGNKFKEIRAILNPEEKLSLPKPLKKKPLSLHPEAYNDISFYLGLLSVIPFVGSFTGIVAIVFGALSLNYLSKRPEPYGKLKAWLGIILGSFFFIVYLKIMMNMLSVASNVE